jgi:hypothetical protein
MNQRIGLSAVVATVIALSLLGTGSDWSSGTPSTPTPDVKLLSERISVLEKRQAVVGRFQIVNPTPEFIRNAMLLDTITGRTWVACTINDADGKPVVGTENNGWCNMTQAYGRGETDP